MLSSNVLAGVGNTPLLHLTISGQPLIQIYSKLEYLNPSGSVKDRAASYVIDKLLRTGEITKNTTLIESSSGNFGIALSMYAKSRGVKFICVIDKNVSDANEFLIRQYSTDVIKVDVPDANGGYLLNRIEAVKSKLQQISDSYWINQYGNPYVSEAYYNSLGTELCGNLKEIDYLFLGVSSAGTIAGVSKRVKERFPNCKVIAVDIHGSVIFGGKPMKRYIPGIGSSMVPDNINESLIDDIVYVDEVETVKGCYQLLNNHFIFAGGSSGSVCAAVSKYFENKHLQEKVTVATIFPDKGDRYINTIYNEKWCERLIQHDEKLI